MKTVKVICTCEGCGKEFELKNLTSAKVVKVEEVTPTAEKESWIEELGAQYTVCSCGKVCLLQIDNKETAQKLEEVTMALRSIALHKKLGSDNKSTGRKLKSMYHRRNAQLELLRQQLLTKLEGKELELTDSFYKGVKLEAKLTKYKEVY